MLIKETDMRKTSIAIISSVLILTLMGCSGDNSANSASSEVSITTVTIDDTDAKAEADTAETKSIEAASNMNTKSAASKNPDASFKCNGKEISVLNDTETTIEDLGTYDPELSYLDEEYKNYVFSDSKVQFDTAMIDGKESPMVLYVANPEIKTTKNVGVGNTEEEIIAAYGYPNNTTESDYIYTLEYHFTSYDLIFDFDGNKEHVEMIRYKNTHNCKKASF